MVDTGFIEATDKIVLAGEPITVEKTIETVANMFPGRLVKMDTGAYEIEVNDTDDNVLGWLGYEQTAVMHRPATIDTIYEVDKKAHVIIGGDIVIRARLASGQNVTAIGTKLTAAADGELTEATIGTHMVLAVALEIVNATSAAANIIVKSRL
jgi:hypothetical protein